MSVCSTEGELFINQPNEMPKDYIAFRRELLPLMREKYRVLDDERIFMRRFRAIMRKIGQVLGIDESDTKVHIDEQ